MTCLSNPGTFDTVIGIFWFVNLCDYPSMW